MALKQFLDLLLKSFLLQARKECLRKLQALKAVTFVDLGTYTAVIYHR